jgi:alkylhydroperoxidase family enzyme
MNQAEDSAPLFGRAQPPAHYTDEMVAFLRTTKFYDSGRALYAHQVLSNHPPAGRSLNRFLDWGPEAALTGRERRLLILRTAVLAHCGYEFGVHRQQGLSTRELQPDEIEALESDPRLPCSTLSAREGALLDTADALCRTDTLSDEQWAHAASMLSIADIIECLVVVGYYRMCSGLMNALGVPDEGELSALPPMER